MQRELLVVLLFAAPIAAGAQRQAADTAHPAYDNLPYREDWSHKLRGDVFDPIKHITLAGNAWLSLGGSARLRGEDDRNYLGGGAGTRNDNFVPARVYLHADLHLPFGVRGFVEGREAEANGRDLPGGQRTSDRDDVDWGNVFGEIAGDEGGLHAALRVGRQELLFGHERLVSPSDFSNVRRTFQGVVAEVQDGANALTAFFTHPVIVVQTAHNKPDLNTDFWGAQYALRRATPGALEGYLFEKEAISTNTHRTTVGGRIVQEFFSSWQAEIEAGIQRGSIGANTVRAGMIASDFTRTWQRTWTPSLTFGADWSSGTSAGHAAQTGTWDLLYPLGHAYVGYADVLGRRNVVELRAVAQASPSNALRLRASLHSFRRASGDDAIYDVTGAVFRASAPGASLDIGNEVDLTAQWKLQRHLRIDGGGAVFAPGAFMKDTGSAERYSWLFASLNVAF